MAIPSPLESQWTLAASVVIQLLAAVGLTWAFREEAKRHPIVDPHEAVGRKDASTPRGGGASIVVIFVGTAGLALAFGWIQTPLFVATALCGLAVAVMGYLDDRRGLSPGSRLVVQALMAAVAMFCVVAESPPKLTFVALAPLAIWYLAIVWATNAYNFMDGIDGIAGSMTVVAGLTVTVAVWSADSVGLLTLTLAVCSVGFLVWNWSPASVFMGDVGSTFLGFVLSVMALHTAVRDTLGTPFWLIAFAPFAIDTTCTLLARIWAKQSWTRPHTTHLFQLLKEKVGSAPKVVVGWSVVTLVVLVPIAIGSQSWPYEGWPAVLAVYAVLVPIQVFARRRLIAQGLGSL